MFYDNFKTACALKGTTITQALRAIGHSTSCTGTWAKGKYPGLDICIELADYLGISLDELVFGSAGRAGHLSAAEQDWLDIFSRIPIDKRTECRDFLLTHAVKPEKYADKKKA